ncbi:alpha/beta fold hydrolase [Fictibacillus fluitans]|uniref:Alpha/beta hydrolase n=1 Tax=Fictibacillus fluitans TaxID=3058422 RepID=A0ABT8HZ41_9BACL|nr:alpha/beta hydrolase [Fictibacillus sp. NE201]MDN4526013.1 alpha/beta hydrolase [Fictibacillus sp. NE201]
MPEVNVNGVQLCYEEYGSGEPFILLHGLGGDHHMFENEINELKKSYWVIALDSRGHGRSEKVPHYTLEDHVQDVIAFMDHLNIEKTSLLGASMGSYIAQGVAVFSPERVKQLILVVAKAFGKTSSTVRLQEEHADELKGLTEEEQMYALSKYIFHKPEMVGEWSQRVDVDVPVLTPEQQIAAQKALENFDFRPLLDRITAETLVISGRYDGLNPPKDGREVANLIPNARFVEFEHSGHAPSVEEPERYRQVVTEFLNRS